MPKELHRKLSREAKRRGLTGKRRDAYVYGTLNRIEKGGSARRKGKR